jgi:hypothetical protein
VARLLCVEVVLFFLERTLAVASYTLVGNNSSTWLCHGHMFFFRHIVLERHMVVQQQLTSGCCEHQSSLPLLD